MNLDDLILVWGEFVTPGPGGTPAVSVSNWSAVLDKPWLRWDTRHPDTIPDAVRSAKIAIVNLFHTDDSLHIEQIKQVNPSCYCIACPDACVDIILDRPDWVRMLYQMKMADAIGGRTHADCNTYGTLLDKPSFYLPSPIGPTDWFLPFREMEKEDYVLTLDHTMLPNNVGCNVAAVAALQRKTGCRVLYAAARDWTKEYADLAGLKAEWLGHVHFIQFVEITAKARLCVDMYTRHSYGRQQVLCAMVGTPIVGSIWCDDAPGSTKDPFDPERAASGGAGLLEYRSLYNGALAWQYDHVDMFTFENCKHRLGNILEGIELVRL